MEKEVNKATLWNLVDWLHWEPVLNDHTNWKRRSIDVEFGHHIITDRVVILHDNMEVI